MSAFGRPILSRAFLHLVVKELRDVLRDRRAAFLTFVFPLLIYPALFVLSDRLRDIDGAAEEDHVVRLGLSGDCRGLLQAIEPEDGIEPVLNVRPDPKLLEREEFDVIVDVRAPVPGAAVDAETARELRVFWDGALPVSREGRQRVLEVIERYRAARVAELLIARGAVWPAGRLVEVSAEDVSTGAERARALLASFLPAVLVLLFFTGGAFAALDLVAGEKERGTLETLFVHPVPPTWVALSKLVVVCACSLGSVVVNLAGMALARFVHEPSGALADLSLPAAPDLALILIGLVPLAVLTSGILVGLSCCARSFREAQTFLVPVMLISLVPALLPAMPGVRLDLLTVWVPIGNVSLAVRDAVTGDLGLWRLAAVFGVTCGQAFLTLRWAAGLLRREEVLLGMDTTPVTADARARARARRAVVFGAVMLLVVYLAGTVLQSPDGPLGLVWGLALTLWVVVLLPAALFPRVTGTPLRDAWALRWPGWRNVVVAIAAVPAVSLLVLGYMRVQDAWLPLPAGLEERFREIVGGEIPPLTLFLLFSISPAICEELLWRGAFLHEVDREGRRAKTVILVGLFFGLFHLSIHRLVPTGLLGAVLAWVRLRTGSIVPSMVFHAAYNALLLFVLAPLAERDGGLAETLTHPAVVAAALGGAFLALRSLRASPGIE